MPSMQGRHAPDMFQPDRHTHALVVRQGSEEGNFRDCHVLRQEGILDSPVIRLSRLKQTIQRTRE